MYAVKNKIQYVNTDKHYTRSKQHRLTHHRLGVGLDQLTGHADGVAGVDWTRLTVLLVRTVSSANTDK